MEIPLFEPGEMKTGRGGGKRGGGERYSKYSEMLKPHLSYLKEQIRESAEGTIRIKVKDLAEAMGIGKVRESGEPGTEKSVTGLYWGIKYALFKEGIFVQTGRSKSNETVLVMRNRKAGDSLPESLMKNIRAEVDAGITKEFVEAEA